MLSNDLAAASLPRPLCGQLHLWLFELPGEDQQAPLHALLSRDEQARALQRRLPAARHQFICARAALRSLLCAYADAPAPQAAQWRFCYGEHGRPALLAAQAALAPRFNISHAGRRVLLGFANTAEPGVDIQCGVGNSNMLGIARRYFADSEYRALLAVQGAQREQHFLQLWTLKEASSKAAGGGLASALHEHVFVIAGERRIEVPACGAGQWRWWQAFDPATGCAMAAALRHSQQLPPMCCELRQLQWPWRWSSVRMTPEICG